MFNFFKKKIYKKVLICISVPTTKEVFIGDLSRGTDFCRSISRQYKQLGRDELWEVYSKVAIMTRSNLDMIAKLGADVIYDAASAVLTNACSYDIVIVIAHNLDNGTGVEFHDKVISAPDFSRLLPQSFTGILDISACQSASLMSSVKSRCPSCQVIGVNSKTSLGLRALLYKQVFSSMSANRNFDYVDALSKTLETLVRLQPELEKEQMSQRLSPSELDIDLPTTDNREATPRRDEANKKFITRGGDEHSSIFAPSEALAGEAFFVQVFIHPDDTIEEVKESAAMLDEDAKLKKSMSLDMNLSREDLIEIELESIQPGTCFSIMEPRKTLRWKGDIISAEFAVDVTSTCSASSFIGKVRVAVNKSPVANCLFKVKIVSCISQTEPAKIEIEKYDRIAERVKTKENILSNLRKFSETVTKGNSNEADLCKQCIDILGQDSFNDNPIRKVFISSTSDMVKYRNLVRQQVEACGMFPEMYENWPQGNHYPCDECCRRVLASDIVICVLGPKYGFIVPEFNMSMTEIEYRVALQAGKPVLVYITEDYRDGFEKLVKEDEESARRQMDFIREVTSVRLVDFFNDDFGLQLLSRTGLTLVKKDIERNEKN